MSGGLVLDEHGELELPLEAVTETFAILAKRGKGKTNTAVVMTEEMVKQGLPVVVIDPVGVWWGIRSAADGTSDGLPMVIFGGDHADVPINDRAGQLVADVIVDRRISAVLDMSGLSKGAGRRFMTDFVDRLYHRNREALHVVVDEADAYAPQRTGADGARLLGAMEDLVRRGRARGIGVTLITQRPAVLNKDVLTQAEVLITLGMTGPRDVAAIDEWVRLHADEDEAKALKASLPSLGVGDAWVWSPGWLNILKRVHIRGRRTFDSSATPKPGQKRVTPKVMAPIDMQELGAQIEASVEQAKAEDPKHLRAEVRRLERELDEMAKQVATAVPEPVEVPYVPFHLVEMVRELAEEIEEIELALGTQTGRAPLTPERKVTVSQEVGTYKTPPPTTKLPDPLQVSTELPTKLGKAERTVLSVLATYGPSDHSRIALLGGYSATASTIGVALSKLRKLDLVGPGPIVQITGAGREWAEQNVEPLPTGQALLDFWRARFGKAERAVLDYLVQCWPGLGSHAGACEATGYSPDASTVGVAMSKLRRAEVVDGWGLSEQFAANAGL